MKFYSFDPAALKVKIDPAAPKTRTLPDGTAEQIVGFVVGDTLIVHPDRVEELEAMTRKRQAEDDLVRWCARALGNDGRGADFDPDEPLAPISHDDWELARIKADAAEKSASAKARRRPDGTPA